jgi:gliding motility-associated-like protein
MGDCNGAALGQAEGGTSPYNYLWSGESLDQIGAQLNDLCSDTYLLTVVDDNGCSQTLQVTVSQPERVVADFSTEKVEWTILDPTVNFINQSEESTGYEWDYGDGSSSSIINPDHTYSEIASEYVVTLVASNDFGCADTIRKTITIANEILFYIPNTFTPDGNDFNELFKVEFFAGYVPDDYKFQIFNRWGELVFRTDSPQGEWDGLYQGRNAPEGTYVWKIEFRETITDERYVKAGHVTIIR